MKRHADLLFRSAAAPRRGAAIQAFTAAALLLSGLVVVVLDVVRLARPRQRPVLPRLRARPAAEDGRSRPPPGDRDARRDQPRRLRGEPRPAHAHARVAAARARSLAGLPERNCTQDAVRLGRDHRRLAQDRRAPDGRPPAGFEDLALAARGASLNPRSRPDGSVEIAAQGRHPGFVILPVAILDPSGKAITPDGLHWSVARRGGSSWLELSLDDAKLPLPYVIDPATMTLRTPATATTGGAAAPRSPTDRPCVRRPQDRPDRGRRRYRYGDHRTGRLGSPAPRRQHHQPRSRSTPTSPGGSEPASYQWSFSPNAVAAGGIVAYAGVDQSVALQSSGGAAARTRT